MNGHGRGQQARQVTVEQIVPERSLAVCKENSTGNRVEVSLRPIRVRAPRVGETWLADRSYGNVWSFAALVVTALPTVTGARSGADAVTLSLLDALVQLGLVNDGTV